MVERTRLGWVLAGARQAFTLAALVHCVPQDTTPERGALEVTVTGSDAVVNGIPATSFEDGWSITFDRSLIFIQLTSGSWSYSDGDASVSLHDTCDFPYEESGPRLLNLQQPWTVLLRAIEARRCNVLFSWHTAFKDDSLQPDTFGPGITLGPGVTPEDFDLLRAGFASMHVGVLAQRGSVTKRVSATFRFDLSSLGGIYSCGEKLDGGGIDGVVVPSGNKLEARLVLNGEQLFRTQLARGAGSLRFDAWAQADDNTSSGNGDGTITYGELAALSLAGVQTDGAYSDDRYGAKSLADFIKIQSRFFWQFGDHGVCARLPER